MTTWYLQLAAFGLEQGSGVIYRNRIGDGADREIDVLPRIGGDDDVQVLPDEFLEAGDRHAQLVSADVEPR